MRLLFIHQNYPGQWVHLAKHYQAEPSNQVVALTDARNQRPQLLEIHHYTTPDAPFPTLPEAMRRFGRSVIRGQAAAIAMMKLRDRGFVPDIVAGHCGWGETLFVKEVWPETKLLLYAEFFYRPDGFDVNFDSEFEHFGPIQQLDVAARNATSVLALASSDVAITPTDFQFSMFPTKLQSQLTVVHDGIDTDRVRPNQSAVVHLGREKLTVRPEDEIITFVCRNLEPYRGYHIFMRALPEILAKRPRARVIIVGGDEVSYGAAAPKGASWKTVFLEEVGARLDMRRIHFVGRIPHNYLWDVFAVSTCHIYLTYPFVVSWSLLEAMASGCLVIGSATPPVQEMIEHGVNGLLVDFFDVPGLTATVIDAIERRHELMPLREAARQTVIDRYDLNRQSLPRLTSLVADLVGPAATP